MRRLTKVPPPGSLSTDGAAWTAKYVSDTPPGGAKFAPWRNSAIVKTLIDETHGKCAYCEAIIADVAPVHVEHIKPKSKRPELVVDWDNLTLVCPTCNSNKGAYYSEAAPLINPYVDDPERHLKFAGPAITGKPGDDLGQRTVAKLKLMRPALLLERAKRIQVLAERIDKWTRAVDPDEREIYEEVIRDELSDESEFAGTLRAFAQLMGFPASSSTEPSSAR